MEIKKLILKILVFIAVVVLIFSPYLLVLDFKKYSPLLLLIWFVSIAYFLMMKRRERINDLKRKENNESQDKDNNKNENCSEVD